MTEMPKALEVKMQELARRFQDHQDKRFIPYDAYESIEIGFKECWQELAPIVEALRFYSLKESWFAGGVEGCDGYSGDIGDKAREALKGLEE